MLNRGNDSKEKILNSSMKSLLMFAFPLLLSNVFQQLYMIIDSLIVGNYLGKAELAAVGTADNISFLGVGIFTGIATGAGVVIGNYYGARDDKRLGEAVHTSIALSILGGLLFSLLGVFLVRDVLVWMGTPKEVFPYAVTYQRIYFAGLVLSAVYNMATGILRAEGDSRNPLLYLIFTSIINVFLDLIFICCFKWGIAGAALATVLSEAVSVILVIAHLLGLQESLALYPSKIRFYKSVLKKILRVGIPTGVQTGVVALSNIVVQSYINQYGVDAVSGYSSYIRIDGFVILPIQSFSLSVMTFVSQAIGAGKLETIKSGERKMLLLSVGYSMAASFFLEIAAPGLIGMFSADPAVITAGCTVLRILAPGYWLLALTHIFVGVFRGSGRSFLGMMVMLVNLVVLRVLFLFLVVPIRPGFETVLCSYTMTWIASALTSIFFRWKMNWKHIWSLEADELIEHRQKRERSAVL